MDKANRGWMRVKKWYNAGIFPIVPISHKLDDNGGFYFKWLIVTIWTLDRAQFEISFVATTHWGLGFIGIFPFFRWAITIPCPPKLGTWIDKVTTRKPNKK